MKTEIFEPDYQVLQDFAKRGGQLLAAAKVFGGTFEKMSRFIKQGKQLPSHVTSDLFSAYRTVQIYNRAMDQEAGRRLRDEVKRWQAAKVRGVGYYGPVEKPLLESTKGLDENFERVHSWFDE